MNRIVNKTFPFEYEVKETLGTGTFGKVKLGISKITGEKFAIKLIEKNKIKTPKEFTRVEREITFLSEMNHINIIKTYEIIQDDLYYYIIMEYCEKGELYDFIVKNKKLKEDDASYFFYQIINGVEYIHSKNVAHRDLKPENLLLTSNKIIKIIDFGLSNYDNSVQNHLLTTPCGSPSYASPEMITGQKYNGISVDIWSIGIILYAMIFGFLPFEDDNNLKLFEKIKKCNVEYPDFGGGCLSVLAKNLIKKILVKDPQKRLNIQQIKEHPFYLKGRQIFSNMHKELFKEVEKPIIRKIIPLDISLGEDEDDFTPIITNSQEKNDFKYRRLTFLDDNKNNMSLNYNNNDNNNNGYKKMNNVNSFIYKKKNDPRSTSINSVEIKFNSPIKNNWKTNNTSNIKKYLKYDTKTNTRKNSELQNKCIYNKNTYSSILSECKDDEDTLSNQQERYTYNCKYNSNDIQIYKAKPKNNFTSSFLKNNNLNDMKENANNESSRQSNNNSNNNVLDLLKIYSPKHHNKIIKPRKFNINNNSIENYKEIENVYYDSPRKIYQFNGNMSNRQSKNNFNIYKNNFYNLINSQSEKKIPSETKRKNYDIDNIDNNSLGKPKNKNINGETRTKGVYCSHNIYHSNSIEKKLYPNNLKNTYSNYNKVNNKIKESTNLNNLTNDINNLSNINNKSGSVIESGSPYYYFKLKGITAKKDNNCIFNKSIENEINGIHNKINYLINLKSKKTGSNSRIIKQSFNSGSFIDNNNIQRTVPEKISSRIYSKKIWSPKFNLNQRKTSTSNERKNYIKIEEYHDDKDIKDPNKKNITNNNSYRNNYYFNDKSLNIASNYKRIKNWKKIDKNGMMSKKYADFKIKNKYNLSMPSYIESNENSSDCNQINNIFKRKITTNNTTNSNFLLSNGIGIKKGIYNYCHINIHNGNILDK